MFILDCVACQVLMMPFSQGKLSSGLATQIDIHLATCPSCRAEYEELTLLSKRLDSTMRALPPAPTELWQQLEQELPDAKANAAYELLESSAHLLTASGIPRGSLAPLLRGLRLVSQFA